MVKSGQVWSGLFVSLDATGALATPSVGPAGVLYVDGTANGATVTISGSNPYKWSVTLPTLTAGQSVSMYVTATIAAIATASVVAEDVADTKRVSDLNDAAAAPSASDNATATAAAILVTPANKLATAATGEASANVTMQAGVLIPGPLALESTAQAILEDTGTTLPAVIAAVDSDVWSYATRTLTQSSTSTTDSTAAGSIARRRGDSWSISLTIGAITGYTSLWFTAKRDRDNTDAQSVLQIKLNASGLNDGLLYVNGAAATDDTLGSITVSDASTGAIVIAVDETITDDLPPAGIYYDVQALVSGTVSTLDSGTLTITADVTRAVA